MRELITDNLLAEMAATLKTKLKAVQGDGVRALAQEAESIGVVSLWQMAYILGTCWHESRFISQREKRAKKGTTVWEFQEKYWHRGFYGRGFIQLTHEHNYKKYSDIRGKDFVSDPDAILDINESAFIAVHGMTTGAFTGKSLNDYLPQSKDGFQNVEALQIAFSKVGFPFLNSKGKVISDKIKMPELNEAMMFAHDLYYARRIVNGTFHSLYITDATCKIFKVLVKHSEVIT